MNPKNNLTQLKEQPMKETICVNHYSRVIALLSCKKSVWKPIEKLKPMSIERLTSLIEKFPAANTRSDKLLAEAAANCHSKRPFDALHDQSELADF